MTPSCAQHNGTCSSFGQVICAVGFAVKKGDVKTVEVLLAYRANSSKIEPSSGMSAMTTAFASGSPEVARVLLKYGGNPDSADSSGKSARSVAKKKELKSLLEQFDNGGAEAFEVRQPTMSSVALHCNQEQVTNMLGRQNVAGCNVMLQHALS